MDDKTFIEKYGIFLSFFGCLLIVGLVVGYFEVSERIKQAALPEMSQTSGKILNVFVENSLDTYRVGYDGTQTIFWTLELKYEYFVAGEHYIGNRYAHNGNPKYMDSDRIYSIADSLSVGKQVTVHYLPDDPTYSVLVNKNM